MFLFQPNCWNRKCSMFIGHHHNLHISNGKIKINKFHSARDFSIKCIVFPIIFRRFYYFTFYLKIYHRKKSQHTEVPSPNCSPVVIVRFGVFVNFILRFSVDFTWVVIVKQKWQFSFYFRLNRKIPINRDFLCLFIFMAQQHISWISSC